MKFFTLKVRGSSHERDNRPCQDEYLLCDDAQPVVMTVADGHGGEAYCRSEIGAAFACAAAKDAVQNKELENIPAVIKENYDWKVAEHLKANPLNDEEKALLATNDSSAAYGATLLLCIINESNIQAVQLGDGEIHVLGANGRFLETLGEDEDCFNNFTSSLCYPKEEALKHFRVHQYDEKPAAVFVYSDGYKTMLSRPYQLASALVNHEDLQEAAKIGEHGDDQTILIAYEPEAFEAETFKEGFAKTLEEANIEVKRLEKLAQSEKFEQEMRANEEFLKLAKGRIERFRVQGDLERVRTLEDLICQKEQQLAVLKEQLDSLFTSNETEQQHEKSEEAVNSAEDTEKPDSELTEK